MSAQHRGATRVDSSRVVNLKEFKTRELEQDEVLEDLLRDHQRGEVTYIWQLEKGEGEDDG